MNLRKHELMRMARESGQPTASTPKEGDSFRYSRSYLVIGAGILGLGVVAFLAFVLKVFPIGFLLLAVGFVAVIVVLLVRINDVRDMDYDEFAREVHDGFVDDD